jgi:hypothetical protein
MRLPAIVRIGRAADHTRRFERSNDRRQRLRPHSFRSGDCGGRRRAILLQAQEHRDLRRCQIAGMTLLPQPAFQLAQERAKILSQDRREDGGGGVFRTGHVGTLLHNKVNWQGFLIKNDRPLKSRDAMVSGTRESGD